MKRCVFGLFMGMLLLLPVLVCASDEQEVALYLGESMTEEYKRQTVYFDAKASLPVYAAPTKKAYRAAKGKAKVGLKDSFDFWGTLEDVSGNGEEWLLIEYILGEGESRIGWVEKSALESFGEVQSYALDRIDLTMTLEKEAFLTDDPLGSARLVKKLSQGSKVQVVFRFDDVWAYVSTTMDGKPAYGFVALDALSLPEEKESAEFMQRLAGIWLFSSGGGSENGMIFDTDGNYVSCEILEDENSSAATLVPSWKSEYTVIENEPDSEREKIFGRYEILFKREGKTVQRKGIAFYRERLHIASGLSGGFYVRAEEVNYE